MKRFEIWAKFPRGEEVRVEAHKTLKSASVAVDAMNHHNQYELSIGYGFPAGVPDYYIREVTA